MAIGKVFAAIRQMFGGDVQAAGATTGQVLTKQSNGNWAGATAASPGWDDVLAVDPTSGAANPIISAGQRLIIARSAGAGVALISTATRKLVLVDEAGASSTSMKLEAGGLTINTTAANLVLSSSFTANLSGAQVTIDSEGDITLTPSSGVVSLANAKSLVFAGSTSTNGVSITRTGTNILSLTRSNGSAGDVYFESRGQLGLQADTDLYLTADALGAGTKKVHLGTPNSSIEVTANTVDLSANTSITLTANAALVATLTSGAITLAEAKNLALGTTTGTKIGTATNQKLGFYNATPVVQQAATTAASGGVVIDAEARAAVNSLITKLQTLGLTA